MRRNAAVRDKSSLTDPFQYSKMPACSNFSRRMAVPPPQQKLFACSPRLVGAGAFLAEASAIQNPWPC